MKKLYSLMCAVLIAAGLMTATGVNAQSQNARWKGNDVNQMTSGTEVFLYNVGTGRFLIHGGDFGIQGRLFYEDTGKLLTFRRGSSGNIYFETGIATGSASVVGCNVPAVTADQAWTDNSGTFTILFDANVNYTNGNNISGTRNWTFVPVTDEDEDGNYTYYMYETFNSNTYKNTYLGAAYGENDGNHEGDPNGKLVLLSSSFDKAVWSTAVPTSTTDYTCGVKDAEKEGLPAGTTSVQRSMDDEVPIFNVDTKVQLKKLYQWRLVTKQEVLDRLATGDIGDGLSSNLTYLVSDRGFERNDWSFFNTTNGWVENRLSDGNYSTSGRYKYTWGFTGSQTSSTSGSKTQHRTQTIVDEPWNRPLRLKSQWDDKVDAKFGYLEFEGLGTVSTGIKVSSATNADPKLAPGVYKVSCYGFYQNGGSSDHPAYFFVSTKAPNSLKVNEAVSDDFKKVALKKVSGFTKGSEGTATSTSKTGVKGAGYDFVYNKDSYYVELEIKVEEGETLYFGLYKNQTAQSTRQGDYWDGYGYYDMDWAGADQFQLYYLGTDDPVMFDEDQTSFDYMSQGTNGRARTTRLHRLFQKNKWNSFVFPLDLSAVQVRNAFGQDARVAELKGIGVHNLSNNANILDFATVSLGAEDFAIKAGHFYLIMPTIDPTAGIASTNNKNYYTMGSFTFSGADLDAVTIDQETYAPDAGSLNAEGHNHVKVDGTFFSSLNYEYNSSNQDPDTENGVYVPAGAYVIGDNNKVYHTQHDLKTKGFRAWIVDVDAPGNSAKGYSINGVYDSSETTAINAVDANVGKAKADGMIYDMSGRKVSSANAGKALPKGMYIVNGKKFVVK